MAIDRIPVGKAFLCHSSSDKPIVRKIAAHLRQANIGIWLDEREIRPGDSLIQKISEGISSATHLLVFLSKRSAKSDWVKKELNVALMKELNLKDIKVIPILLEDCDLPTQILDKVYIDFRRDFYEGISQLTDAIRPPFQVDLSDSPVVDADELPMMEQLISEDMTELLRMIEDYGLNDPDPDKAKKNVKRFSKWYEDSRNTLVASKDPRVEKLDTIYWLATGETVGGEQGTKPKGYVLRHKPRGPRAGMHIIPYDGRTRVIVIPELELVSIENTPSHVSRPEKSVFNFAGMELDLQRQKVVDGAAEKRVFDFNKRLAIVMINEKMCEQQDIQKGVIIGVESEGEQYFFKPVFVSSAFTLGIIDLDVFEATKELWTEA